MAHLVGYGMLPEDAILLTTSINFDQVACATDMSLFGYDQGVFSKKLHFREGQWTSIDMYPGGVVITKDFLQIHNLEGPTKTKILSTVTAIYDVGCFLGAILAFTLGERFGRKNSILWGTTIMALGTILQATSFSLPHIFVGRVVSG